MSIRVLCYPMSEIARFLHVTTISGHLVKSILYGKKRAKSSTQGQIYPTPPAKYLNFKDRHSLHQSPVNSIGSSQLHPASVVELQPKLDVAGSFGVVILPRSGPSLALRAYRK